MPVDQHMASMRHKSMFNMRVNTPFRSTHPQVTLPNDIQEVTIPHFHLRLQPKPVQEEISYQLYTFWDSMNV